MNIAQEQAHGQELAQRPYAVFALLPLPLAGLVSAFLTLWALPRFDNLLKPWNGLAFGLVIGIYLTAARLTRVWKAVIFAVCSVGAYFLAVYGALYLPEIFRLWRLRSTGVNTAGSSFYDPHRFFLGGLIGAFILFIPLGWLILRRKGFWRTATIALVCSVIGGILGYLGQALGAYDQASFGRFLYSLFQKMGRVPAEQASTLTQFYSTFVVWQTGMALFFALVLWRDRPHQAARQ